MRAEIREKAKDSIHSLSEEIANAVTHGIGTGLSIAALVALVVAAVLLGDVYRIVGVSIYGASMVMLYAASTTFHALQRPEIRKSLRYAWHVADHVGIFMLIAGTYTPILLIRMRGEGGWTFLIVIWSIALVGSIFKIFFTGRFNVATTIAYVSMGWLAIFMLGSLARAMGMAGLTWLLIGGAIYTLGVIPFFWEKLPFNHAIWHLFVMGGSACHFVAIWLHVLPVA